MSHRPTTSAVIRTKCVIGSTIRYWMHKDKMPANDGRINR